jgi:ribonuclease-3
LIPFVADGGLMGSGTRAGEPLDDLQTVLEYQFLHPELLTEALTHPSADDSPDYNRLEFLGDRVLGLIIAAHLDQTFSDADAGELALRFNALVRKEACTRTARAAGLGDYLIMAKSEWDAGGAQKSGILADACEAVIGALYVDGGLPAASQFVHRLWSPMMEEQALATKDPKTFLQEWAHQKRLGQPAYSETSRSGADHDPIFTVQVHVTGAGGGEATGEGPSKRAAEQAAAANMVKAIDDRAD